MVGTPPALIATPGPSRHCAWVPRRRSRGQDQLGYLIEADRDATNFVVTDVWTDATRRAFLAAGPHRLVLTLNYARGLRERNLELLTTLCPSAA
jgi:hypothetical protein